MGPSRRSRMGPLLVAGALLLAVAEAASPAPQLDRPQTIAAENTAIAARVADTARALDQASADLAGLRKATDDLAASMQRIEGYAKLPGLGREFVQTVDEQRRMVPTPTAASPSFARSRLIMATNDARLRAERQLSELGDSDAAIAQPPAVSGQTPPESPGADVNAAVRKLVVEQRDLLGRLVEDQKHLLEVLRQITTAEQTLEQRRQAAHAQLTTLLFWIPVRPGRAVFTELGQSLVWTFSPANWRAAAAVVRDEFAGGPQWPSLTLLVAVGLYLTRRRLWSAIGALASSAIGGPPYRFRHALAALAITVGLALPLPLVLSTIAMLLARAPDAPMFSHALGDALQGTARLLLALAGTAALLDPRGIAVRHFGWNEELLRNTARAVRRFTVLFVPLGLLAALNVLDHAPFANRESLGRVTTVIAMMALAGFLGRLLRRRGPLMQWLAARAPRSWTVRLHSVWFAAFVVPPLAIAGLSAGGYFIAAIDFFVRMAWSTFLALGTLLLYGLLALWVQVRRQQLAGGEGAPAEGRAEAVASAPDQAVGAVRQPTADIAAIGEQTRSLVDLLTTVLLLSGLWLIWKDAIPALSAIGDYSLWTYTETVGGKELTRPLTVGHLFLAILVATLTAVAVRNVGALLDILLLRRLEVRADTTYAIQVIARYALTAAGIVLAANILGLGWSDVQWLVAALGVGLGFGLQEIFGNLVAGLIVLAERPVRLGDVVTIGDVSGTVVRIRARVTTVADFDNREVLIPNKSLITDRVVNWTLSNQTTRLVLKISVAADSDLEVVQKVMIDAAQGNPDVLAEPPARVFCVGFGTSAVLLEIHAFVDSFAKRQRVQHEINVAVDDALRRNGIRIP